MQFAIPLFAQDQPTPPKPKEKEKERLDVDLRIGWDGCYRPLHWTPLDVEIYPKLKKPFAGVLTVTAQQDMLTEATVAHEVAVARDTPLHVPLATRLAFLGQSVSLRLREENGRTRYAQKYDMGAYGSNTTLTPLNDQDVLIGLVGGASFGLRDLASHAGGSGDGRVYVKDRLARALPWDWTGYDALDLLVLYDVDYNAIRPEQGRAVAQWVSKGGRLLIVPGGRPLPPDSEIGRLLPFTLERPTEVRVGANEQSMLSLENGRDGTMSRWLSPQEATAAGWQVLGPLSLFLARGAVGFGTVGVMSGNPAELWVGRRPDSAQFWATQVGHLMRGSHRAVQYRSVVDLDATYYGGYREYSLGESADATNAVLQHLLTIPELRPLHIGWIILLLLSLTVLIGPIDYVLLKKLDRLPWTWATSLGAILLFTVGAYYGVRALRAGQMQVRAVSVIDAVQAPTPPTPPAAGGAATQPDRPAELLAAWAATYAGIFAPDSREYRLAGLAPEQWWASVAPTEGSDIYSYNTPAASRELWCRQQDGANHPTAVPISIWSMQCLLDEQRLDDVPLSAEAAVGDGDRWTITLANRSGEPISEAWAVGRGGRVRLGRVEAHSSRTFAEVRLEQPRWGGYDTAPGEPISRLADLGRLGELSGGAFKAFGVAGRSESLTDYLDRGWIVIAARCDSTTPPFEVEGHKSSCDHIRLYRVLVRPRQGATHD